MSYEKNDESKDVKVSERKATKKRDKTWQTKKCKVIRYDKPRKILGVLFDEFGIELADIQNYDGSKFVIVKYKGSIGKSDFECTL